MLMRYLHIIIAVIHINYTSHILSIMSSIRIIIEDESSFDRKFLFFLFSHRDLKIFIESF